MTPAIGAPKAAAASWVTGRDLDDARPKLIEPVAWQRCAAVNAAEQEQLVTILEKWHA
jgi:hypothetical protein